MREWKKIGTYVIIIFNKRAWRRDGPHGKVWWLLDVYILYLGKKENHLCTKIKLNLFDITCDTFGLSFEINLFALFGRLKDILRIFFIKYIKGLLFFSLSLEKINKIWEILFCM